MPSGAKKRKAAKKKKEQEANIVTSSTNNTNKSNNETPLGNDVPESQDERVSDGGDVGSPTSQDHHNQQCLLNEGNKESEKRDPNPTLEVPEDVKDTANVGAEGNGAAKIQREMKSKDDLGDQNISIKHVECVKESDDGSSSSSSSDNESQAVEKPSKKAIQGTEKASSGKVADDSVVDSAPGVHSIKPLGTVAPDLVEPRLKENEELNRNEDEVIPVSEESVDVSWIVVEPVTNENEGKNLPLPVAPETSNGARNTGDSKITVSSENQPLLASAPQVEQRASWMSCCGLFDLLTGSGR